MFSVGSQRLLVLSHIQNLKQLQEYLENVKLFLSKRLAPVYGNFCMEICELEISHTYCKLKSI